MVVIESKMSQLFVSFFVLLWRGMGWMLVVGDGVVVEAMMAYYSLIWHAGTRKFGSRCLI